MLANTSEVSLSSSVHRQKDLSTREAPPPSSSLAVSRRTDENLCIRFSIAVDGMLASQNIYTPNSSPHMATIVTLRTMASRLMPKTGFASRRRFASTCSATSTNKKKEKVIVISGPTGAGKSRLALELAKKINGEIISADSVQVYQGLDIGSAKPSLSDRKEVPHHLVDILHPSEDYSVGQFFEDARRATRDIIEKGRVPIIAGGTGLYLRWYTYGKPGAPKASPDIANEVHSELIDLQRAGDWNAAVQLVVKAGDPKAQQIAFNDWYRLKRSLEIIKSSGSPPSSFQVPYDIFRTQVEAREEETSNDSKACDNVHEGPTTDLEYDFKCFFLSNRRTDLYRLIDERCEYMLLGGEEGILSEASQLLDIGLLPNSNSATRAIGYRQAMEYLLSCRRQGGRSSPREFFSFLSDFQKASRNFAKRQLTWFRNEAIYQWLDASQPLDKVLSYIHDAYLDQTGNLLLPESLEMKKDLSNRREVSELKAYRPKNRYLLNETDCSEIFDWIRATQTQYEWAGRASSLSV